MFPISLVKWKLFLTHVSTEFGTQSVKYSLFYAPRFVHILKDYGAASKEDNTVACKTLATIVNELLLLMLLRNREWLTVCFYQIILWFFRSIKQVTWFLL